MGRGCIRRISLSAPLLRYRRSKPPADRKLQMLAGRMKDEREIPIICL